VEMITAIHEAGHAVAFSRLFPARNLGNVSIIPDHDEGFAGACSSEGLWGDEDEEHLADHDTYVCAGYAAVLTAGYSEEEAAAGCENDFEEVLETLMRQRPGQSL
jgi:ATP-dependent Zn protease